MDDIANLISQVEQNQKKSYQAAIDNVNTQRTIAHDKLANQANSAGLLFSNMAPTKQVQYDAATYLPAMNQQQSNYLTTMDKIIANGQQYAKKLQDYEEAITKLNNS